MLAAISRHMLVTTFTMSRIRKGKARRRCRRLRSGLLSSKLSLIGEHPRISLSVRPLPVIIRGRIPTIRVGGHRQPVGVATGYLTKRLMANWDMLRARVVHHPSSAVTRQERH